MQAGDARQCTMHPFSTSSPCSIGSFNSMATPFSSFVEYVSFLFSVRALT
jgi:hypothetical protein